MGFNLTLVECKERFSEILELIGIVLISPQWNVKFKAYEKETGRKGFNLTLVECKESFNMDDIKLLNRFNLTLVECKVFSSIIDFFDGDLF